METEPTVPIGGDQPHPIVVNTGEDGERPIPADSTANHASAPAPGSPAPAGPTVDSPWQVDLETVQAMIDAEAGRTRTFVALSLAISIAALLIAARAHRAALAASQAPLPAAGA